MWFIVIGGCLLTVGDVLMKKWLVTDGKTYLAAGFLIYLLGLVFLVVSFRDKNIAVASMMLILFNVVTLALVSWLYLDEPLSKQQVLGICLGLASMAVTELY